MKNLAPYAKAIVAFLAPTITYFVVQLQGGTVDLKKLGIGAAVSFLGALVVWAVPNTPKV